MNGIKFFDIIKYQDIIVKYFTPISVPDFVRILQSKAWYFFE